MEKILLKAKLRHPMRTNNDMAMKIISTKTHAIFDYILGILLILSPWLWDASAVGIESLIPVILGVSILSISLMTNFEVSVLKIIPMKTHLIIDFFAGIFLAASPWLFGFKTIVYMPHIVFGLIIFLSAIVTSSKPTDKSNNSSLIET